MIGTDSARTTQVIWIILKLPISRHAKKASTMNEFKIRIHSPYFGGNFSSKNSSAMCSPRIMIAPAPEKTVQISMILASSSDQTNGNDRK